MSEERRKILEMLSEGKITPDDADRLLDKIGDRAAAGPDDPARSNGKRGIKWLLVRVDSSDGDKVNVRVPISLIRTGIKLGAILPHGASERIQASGINLNDLTQLADEELVEALAELQVDVKSDDGDSVRIYCE